MTLPNARHILILDSLLTSGSHFLLTFSLLTFYGHAAVVSFGLAMTIALIANSFHLTGLLIPFNLRSDERFDWRKMLMNSASLGAVLFIFVALITPLVATSNWSLNSALFLFIFFHESLRFWLPRMSQAIWIVVTPAILTIVVLSSFIAHTLPLAPLYFFLAFIDVLILLALIRRQERSGVIYPWWFATPQLLLARASQSSSQLYLVHIPFVIASHFYATAIVASLFIARSLFQVVQLVVKSREVIDQQELNQGKGEGDHAPNVKEDAGQKRATDVQLGNLQLDDAKQGNLQEDTLQQDTLQKDNVHTNKVHAGNRVSDKVHAVHLSQRISELYKRYFILALSLGGSSLVAAVILLPLFYLPEERPPWQAMLCWWGVVTALSQCRVSEMVLVSQRCYWPLNMSYWFGGSTALCLLVAGAGWEHGLWVSILAGWSLTAVLLRITSDKRRMTMQVSL